MLSQSLMISWALLDLFLQFLSYYQSCCLWMAYLRMASSGERDGLSSYATST
jgi:hypothetical protein